jgi:hypothetical protein
VQKGAFPGGKPLALTIVTIILGGPVGALATGDCILGDTGDAGGKPLGGLMPAGAGETGDLGGPPGGGFNPGGAGGDVMAMGDFAGDPSAGLAPRGGGESTC